MPEPEEKMIEEVEISDDEILGAVETELAAMDEEPPEPPTEPEPPVEAPATPEDPELVEDPPAEPETPPEPPTEPEPEAEPRPSDEFGSLEKDAPEKTKERFESLKTGYDKVAAERDTLKAERDKIVQESSVWVEEIRGTGTNPEQFGMAINWLKDLNSGTVEGLTRAYETMVNEAKTIAQMLGKPLGDLYNPINDFPDLAERVEQGSLSEQDAIEIAQSRAGSRLFEKKSEVETQRNTAEQAVTTAKADVKALGEQLRASDPNFAVKMPYLEPIIKAVVQASPNAPHLWKDSIRAAYERLPVVAAPAPTKPAAPAPLRPGVGGPAGGLKKEPGNEMEALEMALERGY